MLTNKQISAMTQEQRIAWLDGMTADERLIVHTPVGYRYTMVFVAHVKRALVSCEMPVGARLQMLEAINGSVDSYFTAAALAAIEPACDTEAQMIEECLKIEDGKGLDLLASWEVFGHLLALNPSLLAAIKLSAGRAATAVVTKN
jgi:hypothetical protein